MACLKDLTEPVLIHVRLTPQANAIFDANEIAASTFVLMEVSGLIGSRTLSLTPRAHVIGTSKSGHARTSPPHTLSSQGARFSRSRGTCTYGPILEVLGPRPGVPPSALYPPGHLVWILCGPI